MEEANAYKLINSTNRDKHRQRETRSGASCAPLEAAGENQLGKSFSSSINPNPVTFKYDVAISVAGENRNYAGCLYKKLINSGLRVFYDAGCKDEVWGENVEAKIKQVYGREAMFCMPIISNAYLEGQWTLLEWSILQERANSTADNLESVLPIVLENLVAEIPIGYIDARKDGIEVIAQNVLKKVQARAEVGIPHRFENASAVITLDLLDQQGTLARYTKRMQSRARIGFDDYIDIFSTDGSISDFCSKSSELIEVKKEMGEFRYISKLIKKVEADEYFEYECSINFLDSFSEKREYFSQRQYHPTQELVMRVRFPPERPCVSFSSKCVIHCNEGPAPQPRRIREGNRDVLELKVQYPILNSMYTVEWSW